MGKVLQFPARVTPIVQAPAPKPIEETIDYGDLSRDTVIARIRSALKRRSGRQWSVTGGRGTAWGWIRISVVPRDLVNGRISEKDGKLLANLLGLDRPVYSSESIPAGNDYYREYIDRVEGRVPRTLGRQYWD